MSGPVTDERRGSVAVLTIDNPPVNALGHAVRQGLVDALARAEADDAVAAVVVTGAGRGFSGGADIKEFGAPPASPMLREVIDRVEGLSKPVIAAIHGTALGGGCELALGCHYRVGDGSARIGLPEVKLGLIPGAGGTQRLPRLVGAGEALAMIVGGDPVDAEKASAIGLLDRLIEDDLVDGAVAFAERLGAEGAPLRKARDLAVDGATDDLFQAAHDKVARRARGLIAPLRCIASIENAAKTDFDAGMAAEREMFVECRESDQSKAQRYLFFAEREAAKVADVSRDTPVLPVKSVGLIGCGTMGAGIAVCFADAGIPVTVLETSDEALEAGLERIAKTYGAMVGRGRLAQTQADERLGLITGVTDYGALADADMVVEAVFEDMGLKKRVFGELDRVCRPDAILATNTSTLDVDEIAAATSRPEMVIGTHFFSPANIMRLMENVRGAKTSKEVIATVMALSKKIGKVAVLVGVCDGFVGNRMYHRYTRQAYFLLEEGALPHEIDKVFTDFGFAMGPLAVGDLAGLDVSYRVRQRQKQFIQPGERWPVVADRVCEAGRLGQKNGKGWYRYEEGSRKPLPDPEAEALIAAASAELGIERRAVSDQEIHERCLYALINEGAKILDEGIVQRASDIDVVWINGYGFPIARGGPMFYADQVGAAEVYERLAHWAKAASPALEPAPLLEKLAREGGTFADL